MAWTTGATAPAQQLWPASEYGIHVGTGFDEISETGVGYGIEKVGHGSLVEKVENAIDQSSRKPDFLMLHCFGAWIEDSQGNQQMELNGWEVMRDGGYGLDPHPVAVETLPLWGEMLDRQEIPGVLYLGSPYNPASTEYFEARPEAWRQMADWTLRLAKESGFDYVAIDAIVRYGEGKGPDEPMRLFLLEQAERHGLQVVVEAWPHETHEPIFDGAPAWMTYRAFLSQHPLATSHRWGQASADDHTGLVVYSHLDEQLMPFDASVARQIVEADSLPVLDWDLWPKYAGDLPPVEPGQQLSGVFSNLLAGDVDFNGELGVDDLALLEALRQVSVDDAFDLLALDLFGRRLGGGAGAALAKAVIPEPVNVVLLTTAVLGCLHVCRIRR